MAKRPAAKAPAKKAAKAAAVNPTGRPGLLGVIRGAIVHKAARPILGRLSGDDLDVLAKHMSAGTLMPGLTPIADHKSKDDAVNAMPADIGKVIAKLPDDDVAKLRSQLSKLGRDKKNMIVCPC
jgi:hypothetical protein